MKNPTLKNTEAVMEHRSNVRHFWALTGTLLLAIPFSPTIDAGAEPGVLRDAIHLVGVTEADAQTVWGTAHRSGRRSARRTVRRHDYLYDEPSSSTTVVVEGQPPAAQPQTSGGPYYEPVMVEGRTVYRQVDVQ